MEEDGDDSEESQNKVKALLGECENSIREMFTDVQTLKEANYYQADAMYKT